MKTKNLTELQVRLDIIKSLQSDFDNVFTVKYKVYI